MRRHVILASWSLVAFAIGGVPALLGFCVGVVAESILNGFETETRAEV